VRTQLSPPSASAVLHRTQGKAEERAGRGGEGRGGEATARLRSKCIPLSFDEHSTAMRAHAQVYDRKTTTLDRSQVTSFFLLDKRGTSDRAQAKCREGDRKVSRIRTNQPRYESYVVSRSDNRAEMRSSAFTLHSADSDRVDAASVFLMNRSARTAEPRASIGVRFVRLVSQDPPRNAPL
jgi:hypothetical protein